MLKINFWLMVMLSFMCLYIDQQIIEFSIIAVVVHEIGHIVVILLTKRKINKCYFELGTVNIETNGSDITVKEELLISSAGCVFNLILIILACIVDNKVLLSSNFAVMIFNLLPISGLDGYDILSCVLSIKLSRIVSVVFNLIILILGFILIFNYNFSLFFAALYLLIKQRRIGVI